MPVPSRLAAFVAVVLLFASSAPAQQPKDKEPPKASPSAAEEQKAREAFGAGKLDEALKSLQAAGKLNPLLPPAKVVAARWCVEVGQGQQARLLIEQAAVEDPTHPEVLLTNASFALAEGRVTDAILNCTAALQAADNPRWDADAKKRHQREARLGLAAAFDVRGDYASVRTHLAALLEDDKKNAQLRHRLARAHFLLNKPDDSFAELQTAFKDDATLDPPELTMAQLWTRKHDFAKADEWYGKAAAAHSGLAKVHRSLAGYQLDRGRPDTAKVHLAAAQKIEPDSRDTKALAGLFARYNKDYAAAAAIFEELVKKYPTDPFATPNLALVLAESGDAEGKRRAVELAEVYLRQNQRNNEAGAVMAYCLLRAGRAADAARVARSVLSGGSMSPDGAYFVAKVLADREAFEDAQKLTKAALESKDGFVHRKDAEALLAELDKKVPPPKK